jgi:peptidoglycan/xylan/chitin deacetylase (PgdA/CDA1 family)
MNMLGMDQPKFGGNFTKHARLAGPVETVISNFQAGHGWVKETSSGTMTDDTTDYVRGSQSLKLTGPSDGNTPRIKLTLGTPLDVTGKVFKIILKVDNPSALVNLQFGYSSDGFAANWVLVNFKTFASSLIPANEWFILTVTPSMVTETSGSTVLNAINAFRFYMRANNGVSTTLWLGGLSYHSNPAEAACILTFDDGFVSQFTEARKKMDTYNYPGVAYIINEYIDVNPNYMTSAQLRELQDFHGWDISGHASGSFDAYSDLGLEAKLVSIKDYLLRNGYAKGAEHIAYPNGVHNPIIRRLTSKYFTTARTVTTAPEVNPPSDYMRLKVFMVTNTTTTSAIATAVANALNNKELLILVFHKIVTSPSVETEYSVANFSTVIENIHTQGIKVRTLSDVFG